MEKKSQRTLILSGNHVNEIVQKVGLDNLMDLLISKLNSAIETFNPKETVIPIRSGFNYKGENPGLIEWMPVHKKGDGITIKVVGYHPKNPAKYKLPTILSSISSYDTTTGHLKGIADGVLLTALRTGAASAVASKLLASSESSCLGLIGCGAQAVTQLHALSRCFDIKKVLVYDSDPDAVLSFNDRCSMLGLHIQINSASISEIMKDADIVCTATSIDVGEGPLFDNLETNSQIHINAAGSDFPGKIELPISLLTKSVVVPDFLEQAKIEGECQQLPSDDCIGPDLAELVQNSNKFSHLKDKRTVFDSTGWALEDQVVMDLFLELAQGYGIGTELNIENTSDDAKNPYHYFLKPVAI